MPLKEIFASAAQEASVKAMELLTQPVEIMLQNVSSGGWETVSGAGSFSLAIPVSYGQDVTGPGVLFLNVAEAALIAELMFGNDPSEVPSELSEVHSTAAVEAISQILYSMADGMGRAAKKRVTASAGAIQNVAPGGVAAFGKNLLRVDRLSIIDFSIKVGTRAPGRMILVLPQSVADSILVQKAGAGSQAVDMKLGEPQAAGPGGSLRVQQVQFGTLQGMHAEAGPSNLDLLLDVPLEVTVELGRAKRRVRDVLSLGPGSIVELSKLAGEPVDLLINGKPIARGEVVVIDESFAIRIVEVLAREERLTGGL